MTAGGGLYSDPSIYDILHTPGTARELDVLESIALRYGPSTAADPLPWLEPACGTGRLLRLAARRGRRVIGFDAHTGMLAYARQTIRRRSLARRARLFRADLADFGPRLELGSVSFAFIPFNSIRHLPDDAALDAHVEQIAHVLRPGGLYAVGISLSDYDRDRPEEDVWQVARGRCRVTWVLNYLPPDRKTRREQVLSHLVIRRPTGTEHRDAAYPLRSYSARQWSAAVRRSPLSTVASLDDGGRPRRDRSLNYQLEILGRTK